MQFQIQTKNPSISMDVSVTNIICGMAQKEERLLTSKEFNCAIDELKKQQIAQMKKSGETIIKTRFGKKDSIENVDEIIRSSLKNGNKISYVLELMEYASRETIDMTIENLLVKGDLSLAVEFAGCGASAQTILSLLETCKKEKMGENFILKQLKKTAAVIKNKNNGG